VVAIYFLGTAVSAVRLTGIVAPTRPAGVHLRHRLMHGVMAATMVYMYSRGTPNPPSGMDGMSITMSGSASGGDPAVTMLLTLVRLVSGVWQLDGIGRLARSKPSGALARVSGGRAPIRTIH
jgi:Domain of unknown function (DUF5134)